MNLFTLPQAHEPVMRVPLAGASCATCRYLRAAPATLECTSAGYQLFMGTAHLVDPTTRAPITDARSLCSDWYEKK
jgi:hypothetical protein